MKHYFFLFFAPSFIFFWILFQVLTGCISGWYTLMRRFPNQEEKTLIQLRYQSGTMGDWCGMRGILSIGVCSSGLRLGIMKFFGIFSRDIFVPWDEITIQRKVEIFETLVELSFGHPCIGRLSVNENVAYQLARSIPEKWPEPMPFKRAANRSILIGMVRKWFLMTSLSAIFFIVVPRIISVQKGVPPLWIAILFPTIFFGVHGLLSYYYQIRKSSRRQ